MEEADKIQDILIQLQWCRDNINRLVSNGESERNNYKEKHSDFYKKIGDSDKFVRDIMFDQDKGFLVKVDRLIQTTKIVEEALIKIQDNLQDLQEYKTEQQGSLKVIYWLGGIIISILVGVIIFVITKN